VVLYYPIPIAALVDDGVPGMFTLAAMDSVEVAVTARRVHYWNYELVPAEALAPNTAYELTGRWLVAGAMVTKTLRFTTGAGPLEGAPAMPDAMLEHYQLTLELFSSCDPQPSGSCLSFGDGDAMVEYAHVDEFGQVHEPYLGRGSAMTNLSGIDQGTNFDCVKLRTRAMNGTYSEPQTLCRADGSLTQLTSTDLGCAPEGLTSAGVPVGGMGTGETAEDDAPPVANEDTPEPPHEGVIETPPRVDDAAGDGSEASEPDATPAASSASCSAVRSTGRASWALSFALVGLAYLRRRWARSSRFTP